MKVNNKYIDSALKQLDALKQLEALKPLKERGKGIFLENGNISSKYKGYVASFGGSIVQIGVYATFLSFCADEDKKKIADLICNIYVDVNVNKKNEIKIPDIIKEKRNDHLFQKQIAYAVVALKLVIRIYQFDDTNIVSDGNAK